MSTFEGRSYTFSFIDGLTPAGGNYVRSAASRGGSVGQQAIDRLADTGVEITTELLKVTMQRIIGEALSP